MSITDELRHEVANYPFRDNRDFALFEAIADRIDIAHKHAIGYVDDRDPETMAENGWVHLPKDADGEYIRIGDALTDDAKFKSEGKVMRLMLDDEDWMVGFGCGGWTEPSFHEWHHYHAPTVEDVLLELLDEAEHFHSLEEEREAIAEYAAKLRLAGDAE